MSKIARGWFAVTALLVLTALVVQVPVSAGSTALPEFTTAGGRVFNLFCYFTIQSNLIIGVTCLLLALNPDRPSTLFRTLRLDGLVAITVTGIVFHLLLAGLHPLTGAAWFADLLLHTAVPLLGVAGWLLFGPFGTTTWRTVRLAAVFPLAWLVFTLVRGPIVDYYPYPFIDVRVLGYPQVLANCALVAALFLALAAAVVGVDRLRGRRRDGQQPVSR